MVDTIDEFSASLEGVKKDWVDNFLDFMRENYPEIPGVISYQIPTFKFNRCYVAFSVAKEHFTFHTLDFEMIEELKGLLPKAKFGRGSAKVKYADRESIPILFAMIRKIIARNGAAG